MNDFMLLNFPKLRAGLYPLYKIYMKMIGVPLHLPYHKEGQEASDLIRDALLSPDPCMVCRFGSLELQVMIAYLNRTEAKGWVRKIPCVFRGEPVNYNLVLKRRFQYMAGFFPGEDNCMERFAQLMIEDSKQIDIVGVWRAEQYRIAKFFTQARNVPLAALEPYRYNPPWSEALKGRKVLVVHPFAGTIKSQYGRREKLFDDKNVLPDFELQTLKAVQSAAGNKVEYASWFEALDYMCDEIDRLDFDIALIGAGAYGFPLAAHVKRSGKKAVHMGGVSQLLFGIKGNRWDNISYYGNLYNGYWVRPSRDETPADKTKVEGGSYW
ncbi:MAG: hypothetical protein PHV82_09105 [Victivallaceae bacterium]|nr:hypothetical protein [Victivallaceae bacterium]